MMGYRPSARRSETQAQVAANIGMYSAARRQVSSLPPLVLFLVMLEGRVVLARAQSLYVRATYERAASPNGGAQEDNSRLPNTCNSQRSQHSIGIGRAINTLFATTTRSAKT